MNPPLDSVRAVLVFSMPLILAAARPQDERPAPSQAARILCCGGEEVFLIDSEPDSAGQHRRLWSWRAADSPEIASEHRQWFRSMTDCKPYGDSLVVTASGGGVALVRRDDKRCSFLAYAENAHSACLLPAGRIAVASSNGGDELLIFRLGDEARPAEPIARHELPSAHGVAWDPEARRLWALGYDQLHRFELVEAEGRLELVSEREWPLPTPGGHDLTRVLDGGDLLVTSQSNVYRFSPDSGSFALLRGLGNAAEVKAVEQHPETSQVVYVQASSERWWSESVRISDSKEPIPVPGVRLYKARWDVPRKRP